jgi:uncharacterized membrane protein (DUF485 family)
MQQELAEKIQASPRFQELVERRNRFAWPMAVFILVVYYTYILVIAFNPSEQGAKETKAFLAQYVRAQTGMALT